MSERLELESCLALIRSELAGYPEYPRNVAGETRHARALQESVVSVEHALATLAKFTLRFPSVQEITDTALNLRPQFDPSSALKAEWTRQYGPRKPYEGISLDIISLHWQAIRDAIFYVQGPGRRELEQITDKEQRSKAELWWVGALERDLKKWPDLVMDVRVEIDALGWDEIMQRSSPEPGLQCQSIDAGKWESIRAYLTKQRGDWKGWKVIPWREIYRAMESLGYELSPEIRRWYFN